MIARYRRKAMETLFTDQTKFETYLAVEIATLEACAKIGKIPKDAVKTIKEKATVDVARIQTLEATTHHDVIAFTRQISETLGPEKKFFHYGLTSTDVVDTALACMYKRANSILEKQVLTFMTTLKEKAMQYKLTPCIGRTHGIHAEVTSFGLKFALYYDMFSRHLDRFRQARKRIETGKLSGAVGNHGLLPPVVQDDVCERLGLNSAPISTQVLPRDYHAEYMSALSLMASGIEVIATEIRHLQRTEVREVNEYFSTGQKGSSAMPHKQNPIASENMCGCARIMRGYMHTMQENIVLWHERDISHSSVERVVLPDAIMLLDYMLNRFNTVIHTLVVHEDTMQKNIQLTHGVVYSQKVLTALIDVGVDRETAYDLIQPLALKAYNESLEFKDLLQKDNDIMKHLTPEALHNCFDPRQALKTVDEIYNRVFKGVRR